MTKTGWIIFITVVVLGLGALVTWTRIANPPLDVSDVTSTKIIKASEKNGNIADHVSGKADSTVVLIEYGDYQCPGCGGLYPSLKQLTDEYGDRIAFVFRNFPLTSMHPNAKAAAGVAEAAGRQGKYWQMHDRLYEGQSEWSSATAKDRNEIFERYADLVGLDIARFKQDLASSEVAQKINFDQALGKRDGVNATPTLFIGDKKLSDEMVSNIGKGSFDEIKKELDSRLQ